MILGDLLGRPVLDAGQRIGLLTDLRFVLDEQSTDQPTPPARLYGLVVSPHTAGSFLGYERAGVTSPWPISSVLRWRERGSFLVLWPDVAELSADRIVVRPGFRRWSTRLSGTAVVVPDMD